MSIGDRLRAFREAKKKKLSQGDIEQRTGLFRSYGTGVRRVGVKSLVFFLLFLPVVPSKSGDEPRPTNEQKGTQIILQARAAVCDPSVLAGLRSISVDADVHPPQWMLDRTGTTQQAQSRSLHLDFLLPDRFKAVLTTRMNSSRSTWITAWNGGEPWSDMITPDARATINKVFEPGAEAYDKDLNFRRHVYAEFVRDLMMWLLIAPDLSSFHYTYAGVHRTPTGTTEMVDVTGPNDTGMRLFIDQGSHQLVMIHYTGLAPYTAVMLPGPVSGLPPPSRSGSGGGIPKIGIGVRPQRRLKQKEVEAEIQLSDHRLETDRLLLMPHHITFNVNRRATSEWELRKITLNPAELKTEDFDKQTATKLARENQSQPMRPAN